MTKKIQMDTGDNLLTDKGPMHLNKGEVYDVPDWAAASLIGRGFAHEIVGEVSGPDGPLPAPVIDFDVEEMLTMNVGDLRDLAKSKGIENWKTAKKAELQKALQDLAEQNAKPQNPEEVNPPPAPFEAKPLTGGIQPPEFKKEE